ncbi:hypothetical protein [Chrysiogenes arsenatis]|uniref:hypothetical protein n=1 Tax=Chrysiogenes arsenatis TaxID=309797 RepID=UPI00135F19FE|nr:hypothetical protein [Chrysiogenes arsenatis]
MLITETLDFLGATLTAHAPLFRREGLPWRTATASPYHIWVSEVMLQQTQVSRVTPFYTRFITRFPSLHDLQNVPWEEFLPYYAGLGYYQRGRNMLLCAQRLCHEYGGMFPNDETALRRLPGIGSYTARAILAFGFGQAVLACDTNLEKVLGRYLYGEKRKSSELADAETALLPYLPELNGLLMDFAGVVCRKEPHCEACPLRPQCCHANAVSRSPQDPQIKQQRRGQARATIVWLHEKHQHYYSATPEAYMPFTLPPEYVGRSAVKQYFRDTWQLDVSVRPPFARVQHAGVATDLVNAQILDGSPAFTIFPANAARLTREAYLHQSDPPA